MLGLILACGTLGFFFENICGIKQRYRRRPQRHEEDERRGNVRRRGGQQNKGPGEGAIWSTSRHRQPTGYVCPRPFSSAVATGLGVLSSPFSYLTLLQARQTWDSLSFCRSTRCMNTVSITHGACACVPVHHPVCLSAMPCDAGLKSSARPKEETSNEGEGGCAQQPVNMQTNLTEHPPSTQLWRLRARSKQAASF